MKFRGIVVTGFIGLIFLAVLLSAQISQMSRLAWLIVFAGILLVEIVLLLLNDEFTSAHIYTTIVLFVSLGWLIIMLMGAPTLTSVFVSMLFILVYLFTIMIVLVHDWNRYGMFDRMMQAKSVKEAEVKERRSGFVPVEELIAEPQHFWIGRDGLAHVVKLQNTVSKRSPSKSISASTKNSSKNTPKKPSKKRSVNKKS